MVYVVMLFRLFGTRGWCPSYSGQSAAGQSVTVGPFSQSRCLQGFRYGATDAPGYRFRQMRLNIECKREIGELRSGTG